MIFTLNTTVFAEEVAVDSVDDAVEATVDAVDEVAEEATVDDTDDTVAATEDVKESQGFKYTTKDGKVTVKTTVKYGSDGAKKNAKYNVATITDTTNPVSWNNSYGKDLMAAVLFGGEGDDTYLNNSKPVSVSLNTPVGPTTVSVKEIPRYNPNLKFKVIPVTEGSTYLFVAYGIYDYFENPTGFDYHTALVAGHDDAVATAFGETYPESIPVTVWDGRTVEFNKSGKSKFDTGKKEAIDVYMSLVTYANGTVTEVNGVEVGSVKVDKKNQKAASVEADTQPVSKTYKDKNFDKEKGEEAKDGSAYFLEHKTLTDLPFFTISAKLGKDAKSYKKDVNAKLKEESNKFYFGIMQHVINVNDSQVPAIDNKYKNAIKANEKYAGKTTLSADDIKTISGDDITRAEESIASTLVNAPSAYSDVDVDKKDLDDLTISKFTEKKVSVVINGYVGDDDKAYEWKNLKALKAGDKGDYSLGTGTLAGTTVYTLDFKDGGNYVYAPMTTVFASGVAAADEKGATEKVWSNEDDLAPLGYKWSFRKTPDVDGKKQKTFRYGVFKANDNGFVYSVDETAVDSVEEAF